MQVRLVAISKLKPAADILALHNARHLTGHDSHFGENYFQGSKGNFFSAIGEEGSIS